MKSTRAASRITKGLKRRAASSTTEPECRPESSALSRTTTRSRQGPVQPSAGVENRENREHCASGVGGLGSSRTDDAPVRTHQSSSDGVYE
ncbi:unnamed protein product [Arctogadus glacialis]